MEATQESPRAPSWLCTKRDGHAVPFDPNKISAALFKCFASLDPVPGPAPSAVTRWVVSEITAAVVSAARERGVRDVEQLQRLVIQQLWTRGLFDAAERYQNYRETHRKKRALETACVFDRRVAFKPFDYPDAVKFKEAIQDSFWLVSEFNFVSDTHDYHANLTPVERAAAAKTLLAISQIEVSVKKFWSKLGDRFQRPEFDQVGGVFGESEIRHCDAYSMILEVLGLNDAFQGVTEVPAIKSRIEYLSKALKAGSDGSDRSFAKTLATFALLVENVSLFGQFAIVKSYAKHKGYLQNVDNVVQATQKEELVHAQFGIWLVNLIRAERPEWFDGPFYADLNKTCQDAFASENNILNWIFEDGAPAFISRPALREFLKARINDGVTAIGGDPVYKIDRAALSDLKWFDEEVHAPTDVDFFHKKSTSYTSRNTSITASDLF